MRKTIVAAVAAATLLAPAAARAHVTLQPGEAPAGGYTRLDVRVPNERDDAATTKIDIQFPPGFESASYEPVPGWKAKVAKQGGEVSQLTFSGGEIAPGEFQDFGLSLKMPGGKAGDKLTFKALQTYDSGEVVRWIGPEDSDDPAPTVTLAAGEGGAHAAAAAAAAPPADGDDASGDGLAIAALVVGALALIAALVAVVRRRPVVVREA
jgi:uncharacterized protein YcnI